MSLQSKMWLWINQIKIRQTTNKYKSQHLAEHSFLFEKVVLTACLCLQTRSGNFIVKCRFLEEEECVLLALYLQHQQLCSVCSGHLTDVLK